MPSRFPAAMMALVSAAVLGCPALADDAPLEDLLRRDRLDWIEAAKAEGRSGLARKTRPVDARPALLGEIVVTRIKGQGVETRSKPGAQGDMVVRNRCDASGNEEILVSAEKFPSRYGDPMGPADEAGYREYRPSGAEMIYAIVPEADGSFAIEAPWGELQRVMPGDAIVQIPEDPTDTYRIERRAFDCTYEVILPAGG